MCEAEGPLGAEMDATRRLVDSVPATLAGAAAVVGYIRTLFMRDSTRHAGRTATALSCFRPNALFPGDRPAGIGALFYLILKVRAQRDSKDEAAIVVAATVRDARCARSSP